MAPMNGFGPLANLKLEDMRAKEDFRIGDQVRVIGRTISGRIIAFDPDHRLARLETMIGKGWWYLKDMKKI